MPVSFGAVPTYDYRCERCSTQFELWQSFSDDSLAACPAEGGPASCVAPGEGPVKKVFSGVAVSFKGDGFYKNDHGANARGRDKERETSSSKDKDSAKDSSKDKDSSSTGTSSSSSDSSSSAGRAKADASASSPS